jgi:hypothetical protein
LNHIPEHRTLKTVVCRGSVFEKKNQAEKAHKKARERDRTNKNEGAVIITMDDSCGIKRELKTSNRTNIRGRFK